MKYSSEAAAARRSMLVAVMLPSSAAASADASVEPTEVFAVAGVDAVPGVAGVAVAESECEDAKPPAGAGATTLRSMTKITPSRGFCIEISAAFVVTMGSFLGLPLSTTHCQVGATVGVGLCEGKNAVNTQMIYKIMVGWVITLAVTGVSSGLLYLVMAAILH